LSLLDVNILLEFAPGSSARIDRLPNPAGFMRRLPLVGPTLTLQPRVREFFGDVSVLTLPSALYPLIDAWGDGPGRLAGVLRRRRLGAGAFGSHDAPGVVLGWLREKGECLERYLSFVHTQKLTGLLLLTPATWLQVPTSLTNRVKTCWSGTWVRRQLAAR
jgi:hypothetical protein